MTGNSRSNTNTARKGTANRGTAAKKRTSGKTPARRTPASKKRAGYVSPGAILRDEIILWSMLAISILILISNFGLGGSLGNKVSTLFFGIFGFIAYLIPFLLFFTTAFIISNRGNKVAWIKTAAAYVFAIALSAIFELVVNGYIADKKFMEYYNFSSKLKTGGGLAGGMLCEAFCPAIGVVGAFIMVLILMIICMVLITERSMVAGLKKHTGRVFQNARKDATRRKEISEAKREQRDIQREMQKEQELKDVLQQIRAESAGVVVTPRERKKALKQPGGKRIKKRVSGVSMDTSLLQGEENDQGIHEILPSADNLPSPPTIDFAINGGEVFFSETVDAEKSVFTDLTPDSTLDLPFEMNETAKELDMQEELLKVEFDVEEDGMPEITIPNTIKMPKEIPQRKVKTIDAKPVATQESTISTFEDAIEIPPQIVKPEYVFPPIDILNKPKKGKGGNSDKTLRETALKLQTTLHNFGVDVTITNVSCGPSVTRYELMPQQGVKVSRIVNLADDIKLNLAAADIRIEAPIPGKSAVGIEVPNHENSAVMLRELLETGDFKNHPSNLAFAAGKDIGGKVVVTDIAKMPHLLIAGATGSGKSVCINTIIMSILYKAKPEDVKLIMIDPKVVELSVYNGIPHLMIPVVTDPKKAAGALNWGVAEMTERYKKFADLNVRDLKGYNAKIDSVADIEDEDKPQRLPQVVIIVDELADLMMVAPGEVEDSICRLAQLARAAGIHLIIATQRPSVNVITGLIKANMPSRIAFSVSSGVDSRTIIDMNGAEKLLGKGDMLFYPQGYQKPARVQGAFVSDTEVSEVVEFLTQKNAGADYSKDIEEQMNKVQQASSDSSSNGNEVDSYFRDAGKFIIDKDKASIGMLQRMFKIGFNRAARIMDQLAEAGVVGEEEGTKPRKVLMSMEEFESYIDEYI